MGPRLTTPAPAPITATEATTIYRQAEYPTLFNIVLDYNQDGSGLTWPTTFFIMFITIAIVALAVFTYKKLRRCHQKRKLKEAEEIQEVVYGKSAEPRRVKAIRPKSVAYDNTYEEVIIRQPAAERPPVPALPIVDHQPAQADPAPAIIIVEEPLAEPEPVAQQVPQGRPRRTRNQ